MSYLLFLYSHYVQLCNRVSRLRYHCEQQRLRGRAMAAVTEQALYCLAQKQEHTDE